MQDKRVKAGQVALHLRDYPHEGEPILFLHFSGANLMMWAPAALYFQERYRLVLVDLRGHGKSEKPESGYHMDEMAGDVVGVMGALGIERAHIIGSSLGAEVGLSLAANHPEKVISLVCDGALSSEYGPYSTWEGSREAFEAHVSGQLEKMRASPETVYPSVEAFVDARRELFEPYGMWNEAVEAMEHYGAHKLDDGGYTRGFGKPELTAYMENYFYYRFEDYYRRVECPLLMLPDEDVFEDEGERAAMRGLSELAPRSQIAQVSGWDHPYGWLLDPEGACKAVLDFLDGIDH